MRIRWNRIIGVSLLGVFVYVLCKLQPFLGNLWDTVNEDHGYDRPMKAIMLGVLCLTFLGGIKLLMTREEESPHESGK